MLTELHCPEKLPHGQCAGKRAIPIPNSVHDPLPLPTPPKILAENLTDLNGSWEKKTSDMSVFRYAEPIQSAFDTAASTLPIPGLTTNSDDIITPLKVSASRMRWRYRVMMMFTI